MTDANSLLHLHPATQITPFDTSSQRAVYRVELGDGTQFQINENLCRLLECLRTPLSLTKLADVFQNRTGQVVPQEQLQQLIGQLIRQGVVVTPGSMPVARTVARVGVDTYLSLHWRRDLLSAQRLTPLTAWLQILYWPPLVGAALLVITGTLVAVYRTVGFPPTIAMTDVSWPLFYLLLLLSIFCHELGHLAACRRWRCSHGALGVGLYFFTPVFYADVSAAWRLKRWQRVVVDLGGAYFQLLLTPGLLAMFQWTADPTYLLLIVATVISIGGNLEPFMKLDGYWLLSDLTGVPNLHKRTGELIYYSWRWLVWQAGGPAAPPAPASLQQWPHWVQGVIGSYLFLSMLFWPLLIIALLPLLGQAIMSYPALWANALPTLGTALREGDLGALFQAIQVLFLPTIFLLNMGVFFKMIVQRFLQVTTRNTPTQ